MFKNLFSFIRKKTYTGILRDIIEGNTGEWGGKDKRKGYLLATYLNRAFSKRADKVSQVDFVVEDEKGEEKEEDDILKVLNNPNKFFTGKQFWKLEQLVRDVFGEVYIWKKYAKKGVDQIFDQSKLEELHILKPETVEVKFNKETGEITMYIQKIDGEETEFKPEEIIRLYNPDVSEFLKSNSLVDLGKKIISTEIQLETYHEKVIRNGGRVDSIFILKNATDIEQLNESADNYDQKYKDAKRSGRPLFLGGEVEYKQLGLTPVELSFLESKKMTLNDVCILTGVPKVLLASVDEVKFANADASIRVFLRETIKPLLDELVDVLDKNLYPDEKLTLTFIDPTPEDQENVRKNAETGFNTHSLTINEIREDLGREPIDGGEVILVPLNLIPFDPNKKEEEPKKDDKGINKKGFVHPLKDRYIREIYHKFKLKAEEKQRAKFLKVVKEFFKGQEKRVVDRLEPDVNRVFRRKDLGFDLLNEKAEIKIALELFIPVLEDILVDSAKDTLKFLDYDYNFILSADIKTFIDQRAEEIATKINETTLKQIDERVLENISEGGTRQELIGNIEELYGDISKGRANVIATTEAHTFVQKGTFEGYKQGGFPIKIWVATFQNTRETHQILDGNEVPIDQPFQSPSGANLMYPGDSSLGAPAEETVNCNCVI